MAINKQYRYFFYSDEQILEKKKVIEGRGKEFLPGFVTVGNRREKITQIAKSKDAMKRYADAKLITEGYLEEMTYEEPRTVQERGGLNI